VQIETKADSLMERILRLIRTIHINTLSALDVSLLVIDQRVNDTIPNSLAHDVFRILLGIELKLQARVAEGDSRVGERKHSDSGLDDVVSESENECPGLVGLEDGGVGRDRLLE
jgi:hypothetical protein